MLEKGTKCTSAKPPDTRAEAWWNHFLPVDKQMSATCRKWNQCCWLHSKNQGGGAVYMFPFSWGDMFWFLSQAKTCCNLQCSQLWLTHVLRLEHKDATLSQSKWSVYVGRRRRERKRKAVLPWAERRHRWLEDAQYDLSVLRCCFISQQSQSRCKIWK